MEESVEAPKTIDECVEVLKAKLIEANGSDLAFRSAPAMLLGREVPNRRTVTLIGKELRLDELCWLTLIGLKLGKIDVKRSGPNAVMTLEVNLV